ncbi:MAG: U32 family peptidase [Elusimicrobiales bacterium]|nr:U32 family peptidase [Elusimicrobiales bacterium]
MIIVAGARTLKEAEWLFANGAGEVYCGLPDLPNHRRNALSVKDEAELFRIIDLAKKNAGKSLLLLNQSWAPGDYPRFTEKVKRIVARGVDGLVVKDLHVIDYLRGRGIKSSYILSSLAMAFNSHAVALFREYGIKRFILPYHLTPEEALGIIKSKPRIETEIFYYPGHFCQNVDPLCKFCDWSRDYKPCKISLRSGSGPFLMPAPDLPRMADIMYEGHKAGVKYLKIPRTLDFDGLKKFIKDAVSLINLLDKGVSKENFRLRYKDVFVSDKV